MGTSYSFITFVGFEVPTDFLWVETTREVQRGRDCGHGPFKEGARFCHTCGAERPKMVTDYDIRPELGLDDDDVGNRSIVRDLPSQIVVRYYRDNVGSSILLAGWLLSDIDRDDVFHKVNKQAPPIDRAALVAVLKERQVPYDPETWGVHALVVTS